MKFDILNIEGNSTGRSIDLPEEIFGIEPNENAVYLAVKSYNAAQRQGTHKAKERGEIAGSTRKIKRQKGTGTARAGSIKSPIFRGGGRIFGPRPRKYSVKVGKKVKSLAKASALSYKAANGSIRIVEDFTLESPKTKAFVNILSSMQLDSQKSVFVTNDYDSNLFLSSRNVKNSSVVNAKDLNVYEIMNANTLVLSESSVDNLIKIFA